MVKKNYDNDFKVMIVELLDSGLKAKQVGLDYGLNASMIGRWKREYKSKSGDFSKKHILSADQQELKRLTKELRAIKMERDILKKAVSIFSRND